MFVVYLCLGQSCDIGLNKIMAFLPLNACNMGLLQELICLYLFVLGCLCVVFACTGVYACFHLFVCIWLYLFVYVCIYLYLFILVCTCWSLIASVCAHDILVCFSLSLSSYCISLPFVAHLL